MLEFGRMLCTPSFPSPLDPLCHGMVLPERALSMGQIAQTFEQNENK